MARVVADDHDREVDPFCPPVRRGGVRLCRATAPADARLIFLAGSCPLHADGSTAAVEDVAGQAAHAVENMRTALAESGASLSDVISTRVLVASSEQADLVAAWEVVRDAFGDHDPPSTLMGVTVLGYDDQLVEIEAVAAVRD
ncbi:RidA family protein [Pseudonocardia sp. ICBG601]|uniref:RidA family protein n=1 Tax=Pseudonocardia sp. ICBG601 TaxID=2846759 RepID=UPI001CF666E6|nr:Rid family hydrolase [Pseudonocardia sp. ICBG601]